MGQIFSTAETVIVWLGLPSEESYSALRLFSSSSSSSSSEDNSKNSSKKKEKEDKWRCIQDICQRPYWRRLWIIQEIILAAKITVQCGTAIITWDDLSTGIEKYRSIAGAADNSKFELLQRVLRLVYHRNEFQKSGSGLVQLLETFGTSICFDPRDKVYGLLGLANDCDSGTALLADYNKSIEEVFEDVVTFYYHQSIEKEISLGIGDWKCRGMMRFSKLLQSLLFENRSSDFKEGELSFENRRELNVFQFVGFFTGTVDLLGPTLLSAKESPQQRSNLLATWYYAIRPHSPEERQGVHEALKNSLESAFDIDTTGSQNIVLIETSTSYATIG